MKITSLIAAVACISFLPSIASAASNEDLYKKNCGICHSTTAGQNKGGPALSSIMGKVAGQVEGYKKYKGLKGADFTWTDENMDAFLANPKKFIKANTENTKTSMFAKVKKAETRAAIIEFLKAN